MTYRQTLDFLYAQLPMFHRIGPAAFKKDLTNTLALCAHLDNPHRRFPSIHVGGTNGKGSVSHLLAAVCQAAGLKTGLYVSPHYQDFRERIKINGRYISRREVVRFVGRNREAIERIQPSFFELCVAMAFDHFARHRVDIAVIEVGLGGRLDSTNVITPLLSVITNISYDHQNLLGDTLPQIAFEKAGIIKPGIPVVIGETHPESAPVFLKKAEETGSYITFADQHVHIMEKENGDWEKTRYEVSELPAAEAGPEPEAQSLDVEIAGPYQAKNLATTLRAVQVLQALPDFRRIADLNESAVRNGLANVRNLTRFMGRWQVIGHHPTILCDSAHNEAGLRSAFEKIKQLLPESGEPAESGASLARLHLVTGFVNDKDVDKVLGLFPTRARYYFAKANIPRGLDARVLKEKAAGFGMHGRAYASVKNALKAAKKAAAPDDLIVVIGSIFVVAEVLP